MSYPSPSIYTYRAVGTAARAGAQAHFWAQYSADSGTTWKPIFPWSFQCKDDAFVAIANIVNDEAQFQKIVNGTSDTQRNDNQLNPAVTNYSYPNG